MCPRCSTSRTAPDPCEFVRLTPDGRAGVIADDLLWPNGIAEAPERALLVSDYTRRHVKRIAPDGSADVFCALPDGLALDAEHALWVAAGPAGSLIRVAPDGRPLATVDVPARFVSSVSSASPARSSTSSWSRPPTTPKAAHRRHRPARARPGAQGARVPLARLRSDR